MTEPEKETADEDRMDEQAEGHGWKRRGIYMLNNDGPEKEGVGREEGHSGVGQGASAD